MANYYEKLNHDGRESSFGDVENDVRSWKMNNFEYYDNSSWVTVPVGGVPYQYVENMCRVQLQVALGTKYWRVKPFVG